MPTDLPVEGVVGEVRRALRDEGVVVVEAPPGAGKSTLLPLRLLDEDWLGGQRIVLLEPRRLAARATARRLAALLGEPLGATVGLRTRDDRVVGPRTRLEVVTEGVLVRRIQDDPLLDGVGAVLLDEVHERHLTTDLSLALTADVRRSVRADLRMGLLSATPDLDPLLAALGQGDRVPVVRSEGRAHPVQEVWLGPPDPRRRLEDAVARAVGRAVREVPVGDVLVFLPGWAEIERTRRLLGRLDEVEVVALAGALPAAEQDRALGPAVEGRRRVVLATDIAESALTVPGVRVVVDAGLVRRPVHDSGTGRSRLVTRPASQAAAVQRAGRAGRVAPGAAYRLWDRAEHLRRPAHPAPEIAAADLTAFALELAVWGMSPDALALPDAPPAGAWAAAVALLGVLGALDERGRPTEVGRALAALPVHPRLGAMVLAAQAEGRGWTGAVLAAVLDEPDVAVGRRSSRPVDVVERVAAVAGEPTDLAVDRDRVARTRHRATQLAQRAGVRPGAVALDAVPELVAVAYPDRIAQRRSVGRFRLRAGGGGRVDRLDPLADAPFLAVAEVDDDLGDGAVRLAAALDEGIVRGIVGPGTTETTVWWDETRGDVRAEVVRRAEALVLDRRSVPVAPGPEVAALLIERIRATAGAVLPWSPTARALQARLAFLHEHDPTGWPDVRDEALVDAAGDQLDVVLAGASGVEALRRIDVTGLLRGLVRPGAWPRVDELAPTRVPLPDGRSLAVTYEGARALASARAEQLFGVTRHPMVGGGRVPVTITVLSPADRPIQVTADLPGFWAGSWAQVRKELAGRYPRHPWPADPATAQPRPRRSPRR